jgi:hypothetical protein
MDNNTTTRYFEIAYYTPGGKPRRKVVREDKIERTMEVLAGKDYYEFRVSAQPLYTE